MNRILALAAASLALLSTLKSYPGLCHLVTLLWPARAFSQPS